MDDAWWAVVLLVVILGLTFMVLYALQHQPAVLGGGVL